MDSRSEDSQQSILNLEKLLIEITETPAQFIDNKDLVNALSDQTRTYKYIDQKRGIFAQSLNRIKRNVHVINGGFNALEEQRKKAFREVTKTLAKSISSQNKPKRGTKAELEAKVKSLKKTRQLLREDMLLITLLLEKSMHQARQYAKESKQHRLIALCDKEQQELRGMLSLSKMKNWSPKSDNYIEISSVRENE